MCVLAVTHLYGKPALCLMIKYTRIPESAEGREFWHATLVALAAAAAAVVSCAAAYINISSCACPVRTPDARKHACAHVYAFLMQ